MVSPLILLLGLAQTAVAQSSVPDRQIPPSVLTEVALLEGRFESALAADCDPRRCFPTGCNYVDHEVADRPRNRSLPGLGGDPGPGSTPSQEFLTRARCGFTHEQAMDEADVTILATRLQAKLSSGWTSVSVTHRALQPLPDYLREAPTPELPPEPEVVLPPPEPEWSLSLATRQLWNQLLPHFFWMVGVVLATVAGILLIWAWRRVGRESIEDQMLLAEIARGEVGTAPAAGEAPADPDDEGAFVAEQEAAWTARIASLDREAPDPELQALIRELLRARDLPLLAKAVLRFPTLPMAFPQGGEIAAAKLELADFLKGAEPEDLPEDAAFFRSLNRHALAAAVSSQSDAEVVRSLREAFGASGLADLIGRLPARYGALLFALAPTDEQLELVRLLQPAQAAGMAQMLLRSNRMDPAETATLFDVLNAASTNAPPPAVPSGEVTDRGAAFDAAGALSVLLSGVNPSRRSALFGEALQRSHGNLPGWYREILVPEMLLELADEARADLMLQVEVEPLAAWLSVIDPEVRERLLAGAPTSLRNSIRASEYFESRARQLTLAERGRRALARGFQSQLARSGRSFEAVVHPTAQGDP